MPSYDLSDKLVRISVPILAPLSPSQDTSSDQLSAFYQPSAIPFVRHSPLPVSALSAHGAASASVAQTAAGKAAYGATINRNQIAPSFSNQGAIPPLQRQINNLMAISFQGLWSASISYSQGASVDYLGLVYTSLQNNNINNTPSTSSSFWSSGSGAEAYQGAYNNATAYIPGEFVSFTDGNFYVCIASTTGHAPTPTGSAFWTLLGTSAVLLGAWSNATAYPQGAQVTYINYIFQALQANTNHTPPTPPATNAFWIMLGPANLAKGVDGNGNLLFKNISSPTATTNTVASTGASYVVIPEMTTTITTMGNQVLIIFTATIVAPSGDPFYLAFFRDGSQVSTDYIAYGSSSGLPSAASCLCFIDSPSAASHTFDIRWKDDGTHHAANQGTQRTLQVIELG